MSGAFRGFGVPQISIAHEGQMNALARELGMILSICGSRMPIM